MTMAADIPLLSLASSPEEFLKAMSSTGFLHLSLVDSPVPPSAVRKAFSTSSVLYDEISLEERCRFSRDDDNNFNGHTGVGSTYLNREGGQQKPDWKEGFGYGRFKPGQDWDQRMPQRLEQRRSEMAAFADGCYELMLLVLDKLSLAFNLPEDYFRACHKHQGANSVTLLNYPPPPTGYKVGEEDIRAGAHKDWGSVTLLFQEDGGQPGLEVFLPESRQAQNGVRLLADVNLKEGKWLAAPVIPDTVLINLGLMMEAWTSGQCVATLHRVVFPPNPTPKSRRSIAYFGTPDPQVELRPVAKGGIIDSSKAAPRVKEFFEERLKRAEVPKAERKELTRESSLVPIEASG
ncbi:Clavaminate synthase-like protein [Rhizodiscina lignyota]|uniref:Clavaminate synthase-like protein n=1 Tax=Rhizodiscina lignyota TaxID=1504668 RepID=A0A9P4IIL4_9PEZI|nr:Clavaminate synthase-like protein [Rhizodiscina lignyota]